MVKTCQIDCKTIQNNSIEYGDKKGNLRTAFTYMDEFYIKTENVFNFK